MNFVHSYSERRNITRSEKGKVLDLNQKDKRALAVKVDDSEDDDELPSISSYVFMCILCVGFVHEYTI